MCFYLLLYLNSVRVVPHGTKGTSPMVRHETSVFEIPKREQHNICSRFTNTVYYIPFMYTVCGYRTSPGAPDLRAGVGLTPRQYTEWNVAGRARSIGDPSQQGLLPEVYRTASTGWCAHLHDRVLNKPMNSQPRTDPRSCARVVYIAGDTLRHQPMGAGHMTAPVTWAYQSPCPTPVLYIAGDTLCYQPMGAGHMTVLQLHGLMGFHVLQWCHPMLPGQ